MEIIDERERKKKKKRKTKTERSKVVAQGLVKV